MKEVCFGSKKVEKHCSRDLETWIRNLCSSVRSCVNRKGVESWYIPKYGAHSLILAIFQPVWRIFGDFFYFKSGNPDDKSRHYLLKISLKRESVGDMMRHFRCS